MLYLHVLLKCLSKRKDKRCLWLWEFRLLIGPKIQSMLDKVSNGINKNNSIWKKGWCLYTVGPLNNNKSKEKRAAS